MNPQTKNQRIWLATIFVLLVSCSASVWQHFNGLSSARMLVHSAISPGRLAVLTIGGPAAGSSQAEARQPTASDTETKELQQSLLQNELQRRQLLIENAQLQNQVRAMKRLEEVETVSAFDLVDFVGLPAVVLGQNGLSDSMADTFIDAGQAQGLKESELVVSGSGILLDKGRDHDLLTGQKVTLGSVVVGRIDRVAQWVSLVQPVTHPDFSAAVQIVKPVAAGAAFGARGLLEGTGEDHCRLTGIPYTESVSVGDEVFSADINGINGPRLYFGRVIHAEFSSGGDWDVRVEPALKSSRLSRVTVIQPRLNLNRTDRRAQESRS